MRRLLTHPVFPLTFQIGMSLLLGVTLYFLFFGSQSDEYNPGSYLLWYIWWASLPLTFLVLGRMWCSICPVGFFTELAQKIVPKRPLHWPKNLQRFEIILLATSLLGIHFLNLWFSFEENIRTGGILILLLVGLSCILALLFQKRIWCRTFCPLGAFAGIMANISIFRLKINTKNCGKRCAGTICSSGASETGKECPMGIDVPQGIDPHFCSLCGKCLKDCSRDSIVTNWQFPPKVVEPASSSVQNSLAILVFLGMSLDMSLYHLTDRPIFLWQLSKLLGVAPSSWFEMTIHGLIIIFPAGWMMILARLGASGEFFPERLAGVARPVLPLAALAVIALNLMPLLIAGPMNLKTILLNAGYQQFGWLDHVRYLEGLPLEIIQAGLVGLGLACVFREMSRVRIKWPLLTAAAITYLIFGSIYLWVFHQPMIS
ncbi:MAG: 4Fe-4S binding protein [Thermodesulfobacteriota bacterium]